MLWVRANPRPLLFLRTPHIYMMKWSWICSNSKHKGEWLVFIPFHTSLINQTTWNLLEQKKLWSTGVLATKNIFFMYIGFDEDFIMTPNSLTLLHLLVKVLMAKWKTTMHVTTDGHQWPAASAALCEASPTPRCPWKQWQIKEKNADNLTLRHYAGD